MLDFTSILSGLGKARGLGITPENCEIHTHNLKVIGSNPIPATKFGLTGSDTKMARLMRAIFVLG
ncbi:hypothetical protein [Bradyrhizobium sp. CCGE-LA001]|uniref:hypothetical protein n=1 Tax=Bradyrhizobium sp. CCGE-LA001 TaxID=1223566 RepID=UPI00119828D7|nr:hypothetical protein [Bradyrhizobium sp. CCGE-LA001]